MGKKRLGFKRPPGGRSELRNAVSSDDEDDDMEDNLESILDDEIDKFNLRKEEEGLQKGGISSRKRRRAPSAGSEEEQEVYGLDLTDDEDGGDDLGLESDSDEDDNDEDILGEDEDPNDGIPDSRAWGRKARAYHNTDYVDQDFGGFEGADAEQAAQEEAEAKEIQKKLTEELDETDFMDFLPSKSDQAKYHKASDKSTKEVLKLDFDSLSLAEKIKLIKRECPEVIYMLDEYKDKLEIAESTKTLLEKEMDDFMKNYYETKYHTILNYCINISYFLYLRASNPQSCKGHPVLKRVLQFRRLLDELNQIKPKAQVRVDSSNKISKSLKPKKILKLSSKKPKTAKVLGIQEKLAAIANKPVPPAKTKESEPLNNDGAEEGEQEKRGITYQIAKNKGLTPVRKKEQRNPRVKHRTKFRKATIRRKGQVRKPRSELKRYDGEMFGIKSHVTKSIKLK